jgi:cobalt/nickel transport system permease protein
LPLQIPDNYQEGSSAIHGLDPRVKVAAVVMFVLTVNLVPEGDWFTFFIFWFGVWAVIRAAGIPVVDVVHGSAVALPFVLAAIVIPFTVPGRELFALPVLGWEVTEPGLIRFLSILLRFGMAVQMAVLLTRVTRFPDVIWALRGLGLPPALVTVISLMYRYFFVIGDEALRMRRARSARSADLQGDRRPSALWQTRVVGLMVGSLFLRALGRSERIHAAMLSRGYDGSPRLLSSFRMELTDWLVLLFFGMLVLMFLIRRLG